MHFYSWGILWLFNFLKIILKLNHWKIPWPTCIAFTCGYKIFITILNTNKGQIMLHLHWKMDLWSDGWTDRLTIWYVWKMIMKTWAPFMCIAIIHVIYFLCWWSRDKFCCCCGNVHKSLVDTRSTFKIISSVKRCMIPVENSYFLHEVLILIKMTTMSCHSISHFVHYLYHGI